MPRLLNPDHAVVLPAVAAGGTLTVDHIRRGRARAQGDYRVLDPDPLGQLAAGLAGVAA